MKLLSFDPSSSRTGYAFGVLEDTLCIEECGVIDLKRNKNPLSFLFEKVTELINKYSPHKVLLETPFYSINAQTLIKLGEVRGVILLACQTKRVELEEFSPAEVKISITGYGRATKEQVLSMVNYVYNLQIKDYDIADAVAILHSYSMRVEV
ncbi:MAG: crossover junction endodeoxyribonuclease RuvC [Hydrogenothermaceae bacterium]|nr:crossover junction endodeoxyribonuclease RuvC [Hydrogenothermaceae bacterium]